jgi:hypothetical protein
MVELAIPPFPGSLDLVCECDANVANSSVFPNSEQFAETLRSLALCLFRDHCVDIGGNCDRRMPEAFADRFQVYADSEQR